jgi:hypothetical protein
VQRRFEHLRALDEVSNSLMLARDPIRLLLHRRVEHQHADDTDSKDESEASGEGCLASARRRTPAHHHRR